MRARRSASLTTGHLFAWCFLVSLAVSLLKLVRERPSSVLQMSAGHLEMLISANAGLIGRVLGRDEAQVDSFVQYCKDQKVRSEALMTALTLMAARESRE
jgi:hypothetical protein